MPLAEGVSSLVVYKFYATGAINSTTEPVASTDPGASGAQRLRRVACTLDLTKQTFESEEFRSDRQITDFRHGSRSVAGEISGELSPNTYEVFFEAATRGTWVVPPAAITQTQTTSVTPDNATSTFTFASGDLYALGLRVGSIIRATAGITSVNINFVVTAMSGTGSRTVRVFPAPATQVAQTTFSFTVVGGRLSVPGTGAAVSRKVAVEVNAEDMDISRLFTECRLTSFKIMVPPNGMATCSFGLTGRNMQVLTGASAPFFTSPTAETSTGICAGSNGAVLVAGTVVGNVTSFELNAEMAAEAEPVVGQTIVPDIILGRFRTSGSMTLFFEDATFLNYFLNETEVQVLLWVRTGGGPVDDAITILLPRVKFGGAQLPAQGEGAQVITMPFVALRHPGLTLNGLDATTFQMCDTQVVT